jgi:dTDP-4-dehydrorhamnose reductase
MVFDGDKGNYSESDTVNPINYYGITKQMAENFICKYSSNYVIVRSALIYGFSLTGSKTFSEIMLERTKNGESVQLFTDQYRTPILVHNLAQVLLELAASEYCGIMHLGGADRLSRYDFGILFAKYFSISSNLLIPTQMKNYQFKAARPKDTSFNIDLAQKILKTEIWDCHRGVQFMKNCLTLRQ